LRFGYTAETEKIVRDLAAKPILIEKAWSNDRKRGGRSEPSFVAHKVENGSRLVNIDTEVCGITVDPKVDAAPHPNVATDPVPRSKEPGFIVVNPEIRIARRSGAKHLSESAEESYFQSQAIFYLDDASAPTQARIRVQCNRPNFLISEDLVQFAADAVAHGLKVKAVRGDKDRQ
jgi:hypothetical protein